MIKGSIQEEAITIINIYAPNIGAPQSLQSSLLDRLNHQRADSRSKKNYNPAACGRKTTFTER